MFVRGYLRASTDDQNAERARGDLERFVVERGMTVASWYIENASGSHLDRPEMLRLLKDAHRGDVILVEAVDRLSRLTANDWEKLKADIATRGIRIVALDLPTSWSMMTAVDPDDVTSRIFQAINSMLLDVLAAIARKDYQDRRRRQAQGIQKAKEAGQYRGRRENVTRNEALVRMLSSGQSWSSIQAASGCSRSTLSRLAKRIAATNQQ